MLDRRKAVVSPLMPITSHSMAPWIGVVVAVVVTVVVAVVVAVVVVGARVGAAVGVAVGVETGTAVGAAVGAAVGVDVGADVGAAVGDRVVHVLHADLHCRATPGSLQPIVEMSRPQPTASDAFPSQNVVGANDGAAVGTFVGALVGWIVGDAVGAAVGELEHCGAYRDMHASIVFWSLSACPCRTHELRHESGQTTRTDAKYAHGEAK